MKKKFVLVLALVLLVTSASVFAEVKFSGTMYGGYAFYFGKNSSTNKDSTQMAWKSYDGDDGELELDAKVADADGAWSISLSSSSGYGDVYTKATATVDLAKAFKQDKFGLSFTTGNKTNTDGLYAFGDGSGNHFQRQRIVGTYISYIDFSMPDALGLKVRLAVSPSHDHQRSWWLSSPL